MKATEKKALYSFFCNAIDCMEGFASKEVEVDFIDDEESPNVESSSSFLYSPSYPTSYSFSRKYENMEELRQDVLCCSSCDLCKKRCSVVFGEGPQETMGLDEVPSVLVVGEAPGYDEDVQARPFVGASGKLLDKMLCAIDLYRTKNCFITNVVKCRPPNNRNPSKNEIACCLHFLEEQIRLISPKIILLLGNVALKTILHTEVGISHLHGKLFHYNDSIPTIATYHPSALLRQESLKRLAWEDLKFFKQKFNSL